MELLRTKGSRMERFLPTIPAYKFGMLWEAERARLLTLEPDFGAEIDFAEGTEECDHVGTVVASGKGRR